MRALTLALEKSNEFAALLGAIENGGCPALLAGLPAAGRAHVAAAAQLCTGRPVLVICADEGEAGRTAADLGAFTGLPVLQLPGRDLLLHAAAAASHEWEQRRLAALRRLAASPVTVATPDGLLLRTLPPAAMERVALTLEFGRAYDLNGLTESLAAGGYVRSELVEGPGQFALRGGILDVFSPGDAAPLRAEFFGDELDSLGRFAVDTQRRTENLKSAEILPAAEALPALAEGGAAGLAAALAALRRRAEKRGLDALTKTLAEDIGRLEAGKTLPAPDRYLALIYPAFACALSYLAPDALVFFAESGRVMEREKNYRWQMDQDTETLLEAGVLAGECAAFLPAPETVQRRLSDFPEVFLDSFVTSRQPLPPKNIYSMTVKQLPSYGGSIETAAADLRHYLEGGWSVTVLCGGEKRAENLQAIFRKQKLRAALDYGLHTLPDAGRATIAVGGLSAGLEYPELRLAVLTEGQLAAASKKPKERRAAVSARERIRSYADLSPGDLVVHIHHGIGRYVEMTRMEVDGAARDYVKIAFAGTDVLYLPATQLDLISKYIGAGEDGRTRLSKLGGTEWAKTKAKARGAAKELAEGLIKLYAERARRPGHAFPQDDVWQKEFEDSFEYEETPDQLRCAAEIKKDMEKPVPMDRLLCGDVGYGKTEVALRAMMKCVLGGRQAALLAPTTVLAQQHYLTALSRFRGHPVRIDVLSRFRTPAQVKETLRGVEDGSVDILIGTHRLLQKDIQFHRLGLLVVDEEQRFGVVHKERLKEMARQVDVLTLTATPIPRTLNMALSGIRDMSVIEAPPRDRQPVQTYVVEHDWNLLGDAMRREVGRGGQVYYLHNRVETIDRAAARIASLVPDARVAVAHGQMTEDTLSAVMSRAVEGEIDVLVCTTIIETGIDIPNVNTLIIEDADKLGLAQLHQLRGRVGRSARRAVAYMTFRRGKVLTEIAAKRLSAIREFAAFGAGFQIAMRDLEIRGAGNLLGPEQSGCMMSVGYDLYLKLLEEAVLEAKGEPAKPDGGCTADLPVSANIPEAYVPSPEQRMELYRRIAGIRSEEEADDLVDELIDRYGDPPASVNALISVALLRRAAAAAGFAEITFRDGALRLALPAPDFARVSALCAKPPYRGRLLFSAGEAPGLTLRQKRGENVLTLARTLVDDYAGT
ncbi:MAG TPA: transcription-repair coupling factor [Oscillospiraceae bacterium]|nr:transcription-repair coupling factor [Oscillospiraceae bacterium]